MILSDVNGRRDRLAKNIAGFMALSDERQLSVMYEIMDDVRYLRLRLSDYLVPLNPLVVPAVGAVVCPYCGVQLKGVAGLRAHLGIKHRELKKEWGNAPGP